MPPVSSRVLCAQKRYPNKILFMLKCRDYNVICQIERDALKGGIDTYVTL